MVWSNGKKDHPYSPNNNNPPRVFMHPECFLTQPVELFSPYYLSSNVRLRPQGYIIKNFNEIEGFKSHLAKYFVERAVKVNT